MIVERERIPALDGVRGIAILMVLVLHLMPYRPTSSIPGRLFNGICGMGWSGVDLFFILSGFLITGILIDGRGARNYFRNFYARRTLRIFPLYYLAVFIAVVLGPMLVPNLHTEPSSSAAWWWLYLSNILWALYPDAGNGWLGVFWSLAIEEHFYLVWPVTVFLCSNRTLIRTCLALICISWICRAFCVHVGNYTAAYCLTPCRMDAISYGALAAIGVRSPRCRRLAGPVRRVAVCSGVLAATLIIWRHSVTWDSITQLVAIPLIDLTFGLSIFAIGASASAGPVLLRSPLLRLFGKYSYGIYVLHVPVRSLVIPLIEPLVLNAGSFARAHDLFNFVFIAGATYMAAVISWYLFEMPFIRCKRYFPQFHTMSAMLQ